MSKEQQPLRERKKLAALKNIPEIRMRNVKPETARELIAIGSFLKQKTVPDTLTKVIHRFLDDQKSMEQLQRRNSDLHNKIARYVERENEMSKLIEQFIKYTGEFNKLTTDKAKKILKLFRGTNRSRPAGAAARPGTKSVPRKKAAVKKSKSKQGRLL